MEGPRLTMRRRKELARLSRRRGREELGQYLVDGLRSVRSAIDSGAPIVDVVVADGVAASPEIRSMLHNFRAPVHYTSDREMGRLSDVQTAQGILASVLIERTPPEKFVDLDRLLLLDGLRDPGNVGTLIRSAAWFGIDAVVAGPGTVDFYNPKVVRASMGGLWDIRHGVTDDLASFVRLLRESNCDVRAADMKGESALEWHPESRSALILGSEAHGVSPELRAAAAGTITVPPVPPVTRLSGTESLNVSSAGAVIMAAWTAKRPN